MKLFYTILFLIFLSACGISADGITPTQTQSKSHASKIISLPTLATAATILPVATTIPIPPISACWHESNTLICNMAYSIMVHSAQKEWLAKLLPVLKNNYADLTYETLAINIQAGNPPRENYVLISIDDLSTYYLPPRFYEMIENMRNRDMVGTLAVVTEYPQPPNPEIWAYYRELQAEGWEIAIHTEHHYNFSWISSAQIRLEIETSYEKICQNTLSCPVTLILPFGEGVDLGIVYRVAEDLGIVWVVGTDILLDLNSGFPNYSGNYFSGHPPYYVSRAAIVEDIDEMFEILEERFPFTYSYGNK